MTTVFGSNQSTKSLQTVQQEALYKAVISVNTYLHGLLSYIGHTLLMNEGHQSIHQLQRAALDFMTWFSLILQHTTLSLTAQTAEYNQCPA